MAYRVIRPTIRRAVLRRSTQRVAVRSKLVSNSAVTTLLGPDLSKQASSTSLDQRTVRCSDRNRRVISSVIAGTPRER